MDHRRTENFYAVVSPGLEAVCASELAALQLEPQLLDKGGVAFAGRLRELYLANLWSRTASRILVRFAEFGSRDFPDLFRKARKLPWGRFVKPGRAVAFRVTCQGSRLGHTARVAETLTAAVNQALGREANPDENDAQIVMVRIVDDRVTLSLDSSGALLHRRGYRQSVTRAPLRETLAAGILMQLGWDGHENLYDPMCGSGSFLIEGALMARRRAPGLDRTFAFMAWPGYRDGLWTLLCDEARRQERPLSCRISGADANPEALAAARENWRRADASESIPLFQMELAQHPIHPGPGLVVCNPPYGKRLRLDETAKHYRDLGRNLARAFPEHRYAILCPDPALIQQTGLKLSRVATLDNGGLAVDLYASGTGPV